MYLVGEVMEMVSGPMTRCPRDSFPDRTPPNSKGTTSPLSSATIQRIGRTKRSGLPLRQYMFFGQLIVPSCLGRASLKSSALGRPFLVTVAARYSPFSLLIFSRLDTSSPTFFAKACAAAVGFPSLKATFSDGPMTSSLTSGCD